MCGISSGYTLFIKVKQSPGTEIHNNWEMTTCYLLEYMGLDARKPVFGGLRTTKAQASLHIRAD